jgi:hypothetical protein
MADETVSLDEALARFNAESADGHALVEAQREDVAALAAEFGVTQSYVRRVLRLSKKDVEEARRRLCQLHPPA